MSPNFYKVSESLSSLDDNELEELFKLIQIIQIERENKIKANALEELVNSIKTIENRYNVFFTYNWERIFPTEIECEFNE